MEIINKLRWMFICRNAGRKMKQAFSNRAQLKIHPVFIETLQQTLYIKELPYRNTIRVCNVEDRTDQICAILYLSLHDNYGNKLFRSCDEAGVFVDTVSIDVLLEIIKYMCNVTLIEKEDK